MKSHQHLLPPFGVDSKGQKLRLAARDSFYNTMFIKAKTTLPFLSDLIITYQHWLPHVKNQLGALQKYQLAGNVQTFQDLEGQSWDAPHAWGFVGVCLCVCCLFFPSSVSPFSSLPFLPSSS